MSWAAWASLYLIIGMLLATAGRKSIRARDNKEIHSGGYVLLLLFWPAAIAFTVIQLLRSILWRPRG